MGRLAETTRTATPRRYPYPGGSRCAECTTVRVDAPRLSGFLLDVAGWLSAAGTTVLRDGDRILVVTSPRVRGHLAQPFAPQAGTPRDL